MTADKTAEICGSNIIDDYTAHLINQMALKFYSKPENVKIFREWHLKTYGCLPGECKVKMKRKATQIVQKLKKALRN